MNENTEMDMQEVILKGTALALELAESAGDARTVKLLLESTTERNPDTWPYIQHAALVHLAGNVLGETLRIMDTPEMRKAGGYPDLRETYKPAVKRIYQYLAAYQDSKMQG